MKKILIIGCPGSGKSTFAKKLHKICTIPLFHLDLMFWNADKTTVSREVFHSRLSDILQKDRWIIDGNYLSTMEWRIGACDTVIFLDFPTEICLEGIRKRMGKARTDMPWIETEEDREFLTFVENFSQDTRPQILDILNRHPEKRIIIFKDRSYADDFLEQIKNQG